MPIELYPPTLIPTHEEQYTVEGNNYSIPTILMPPFKHWEGEPLIHDLHKRKENIIDYKGHALFAELVVQDLAEKKPWHSRWIQTYPKSKNPYFLVDWVDKPLNKPNRVPLDGYGKKKTEEIAELQGSYSRCWDVVAWNDDRLVFYEVKRMGDDTLNPNQISWREAGLSVGLKKDNFVIVQWYFQLYEKDKQHFADLYTGGDIRKLDTEYSLLFDTRDPKVKRKEYIDNYKKLFTAVFQSAKGLCQICHIAKGVEIDHIVPLKSNELNKRFRDMHATTVNGKIHKVKAESYGSNDVNNLQLVCKSCNRTKWHRLVE